MYKQWEEISNTDKNVSIVNAILTQSTTAREEILISENWEDVES